MKFMRWLWVMAGLAGLIGVRMLEDQIFYDPFLNYFHEVGLNKHFPDFRWWPLIASHIFRFILNLIFSAIIIQFLFLNKKWTAQAVLLTGIVFAITFPIYLYCLGSHFRIGELFSFYVRRFVIQPLILLLMIPMFYYRKKIEASALADK